MSTAAALRRRLAELDAAIVEQKKALDALQRDRKDVHRQLNATSTFPVLTLPVEITVEIFSLCLPSIRELREDGRSIAKRLESQAPTVFLGVCRTWRDIALGTPTLWATFALRFKPIAYEVASDPVAVEEFIDMWLGRAALRPLSIIFRGNDPDNVFTLIRIRDIIHRYAPRLEYIELNMPQCDISELGLGSVAFPLLQRAAIADPFEPEPDSSNPIHIYSNAPQLRDLILLNDSLLSFYTPPSLQLMKFEGAIMNLELFIMAPNLTEVRCSLEGLDPHPTSTISHFHLQSLTVLKTSFSEDVIDVLPHLTLPALQFLHISAMKDPPISTDSLFSFLTRSSPPLRTLSARVSHSSFYDWNSCFSCVAKTLENLKLHSPGSAFQYELLNLGIPHSHYNPLPRLRTLHLVDPVGIDCYSLVEFLHRGSTTPTLAKFRSFRATFHSSFFREDTFGFGTMPNVTEQIIGIEHTEVTAALARLARGGIDIIIETTEKTYLKHVQCVPGDPVYELVP
ncbi:hypothetical protein FB451DRAFT_1548470 [Mycena latifolia]|nr:hypothetical protein FB451DRAFT_1548470 [Mycena latifolia]